MRPTFLLKQNQRLSVSPKLQQAIRLLQLSSQELELELQNQINENPLLEMVTSVEDRDLSEENTQTVDFEYDWQDATYHRTQIDSFNTAHNSFDGSHYEAGKNPELSLKQHLFWQMELTPFTEIDRLIAKILIDAISDNGYLCSSLIDILETFYKNHSEYLGCNIGLEEVEAVLHRIQQFDPIGVGARTLQECLELQLNNLLPTPPYLTITQKLIREHLEMLGTESLVKLQKTLNLGTEEIVSILKTLKSLNPKPGLKISSKKPEYIVPDLIVKKKNGKFVVQLNSNSIPKIRINMEICTLMKSVDAQKTKVLHTHLKEAKWFMQSLETRHHTLLTVAKKVLEKQLPFLEKGEFAFQALKLKDIATACNLHESTISRITSNKFIETPKGIFELKYFFSNSLESENDQNHSSKSIRAHIKQLISDENPNHPLSDQQIMLELERTGISVARRTISKYRELLSIRSARDRKHSNLNMKLGE